MSEHFSATATAFGSISLDYDRFNSDSQLENYRLEYEAIKRHIPDAVIMTNFMGFYKQLDYQKWGKFMDFIAWDSYPAQDDPPSRVAMSHTTMRGLKGGKPFALMEQTPSVSNWLPSCTLKRPGEMRFLSYQAVAHGSDTVMFFQMRRNLSECEKFHGGGLTDAKAAILFDWNNWWAMEYSAGPNRSLKYVEEVHNYYRAFHTRNIPTDIIACDDDFSKYKVIVAPVLYMVKPGVDEKLKEVVKNGGTFVTTFFSGYVNENDRVTTGGYPGKLRDLMGIWVEEIDSPPEGSINSFSYEDTKCEAKLLCDILHCEGAKALAFYD